MDKTIICECGNPIILQEYYTDEDRKRFGDFGGSCRMCKVMYKLILYRG